MNWGCVLAAGSGSDISEDVALTTLQYFDVLMMTERRYPRRGLISARPEQSAPLQEAHRIDRMSRRTLPCRVSPARFVG